MEKQQYQSPRIKVVEVKQKQVLCASPYTTKSMDEEDLDGSGFYVL